MAAAAEASAKAAGQDINKSLAAIYLMLGQRDKAYGLWGSAASLGVALQDYHSGNTHGVRIVEVLEGGSAQQAGLKPGDIIVALDDKPVSATQAFTRQIGTRHPGQSVQLNLMRNGRPTRVAATLAGLDNLITAQPLLQPALKVRQIPASAMANAVPPVMASGSIVPVAFPPVQTSASIPQVETPVPSELRIESMRVAPSSVPAGERFEVTVDLFALDQDVREETVAVVLRYTISQQGKALARLAPETLKVPNGVPSSLSNKIRAGKTKGKYSVQVEVEMGAQKTRSETAFSIR